MLLYRLSPQKTGKTMTIGREEACYRVTDRYEAETKKKLNYFENAVLSLVTFVSRVRDI